MDKDVINLKTNIDGLPKFKSSFDAPWPMLIGVDFFTPFVAAIFSVNNKPYPLEECVTDLILELAGLNWTWNFDTRQNILHWYQLFPVRHTCQGAFIRLPLDKMAAISQTTFSGAFLWTKNFVFWLKFDQSFFSQTIFSDAFILIKIWLKFVHNGQIDNNPSLV